MKNKKLISLILLACICVALIGCGSESEPQATAAPVSDGTQVSSLAELHALDANIRMNDAPQGSTNVTYKAIANIPVIFEISFSLNGSNYVYRASAYSANSLPQDISGVTDQLSESSALTAGNVNEAGGVYTLRRDPATGKGVASWNSALTMCQYSLSTGTGCAGDVNSMPMVSVINSLYTCVSDDKTAQGCTVVSVASPVITVNLSDNTTATLDISCLSSCSLAEKDIVDITYVGDLKGSAYLIKAVKTGTATTGKEVNGTVVTFTGSSVLIQTADNNIYAFGYTTDTKVSGGSLAQNQSVTVEYEGELNVAPMALNIKILGTAATPTATPTVVYTERSTSGTVTSVNGYYVSVNGILFYINPQTSYVSGYASVGVTGTINYRDYGSGNYSVTSAYFNNGGGGGTTQTSVKGSIRGNCYSYSPYSSISVDGQSMTIGSNCYVSGNYTYGCDTAVEYNSYTDGRVVAYSITFFDPEPTSVQGSINGYCTSYAPGSSISVDGQYMTIGSGCYVSGNYFNGCDAAVDYTSYSDGRVVANSIYFYGDEGLGDIADEEPYYTPDDPDEGLGDLIDDEFAADY